MRRREFIVGVGSAAAAATWPIVARAQQSKKIPVVGVLWHAENAEGEIGRVEALRRGLKDFGRIEGKNIKISIHLPLSNTRGSTSTQRLLRRYPYTLCFRIRRRPPWLLTARPRKLRSS